MTSHKVRLCNPDNESDPVQCDAYDSRNADIRIRAMDLCSYLSVSSQMAIGNYGELS